MTDRERWYEDQPERISTRCQWCSGVGSVHATTAYVAGPDPFKGVMNTMHLPKQCAHCRGTGEYDSDLDPTLDQDRRG